MERIKVGLVGFGRVGSSLCRLLEQNGEAFERRLGAEVEILAVGVRDPAKKRDWLPAARITADYREILDDPRIQIVIELVGGIETPRLIIREALKRGKHVITANKALLSLHGDELFALARRQGLELKFEASVCGGIPIIKVIQEGMLGNRIQRIWGIVNGTTNLILTRMHEDALSFQEALEEAQRQGFAEADPSLDIDGLDAAQKISLLASISFGRWVDYRKILCEGIRGILPRQIEFAQSAGFVFKLIASAEWIDGMSSVTVFPALISREHPLASIRGEYNAVFVSSDFQGNTVYYGKGAGGNPTASSVASDLGDLVRHIIYKSAPEPVIDHELKPASLFPKGERSYRYFFHFITANRPGIWATVTGKLADNGINIESVHQKWLDPSQPSDLYVLVDPAREIQAHAAMEQITASEGISKESAFYRVL